ncbi:hypothetical protein KEM55_007056, partial [Ascosphaera atra]
MTSPTISTVAGGTPTAFNKLGDHHRTRNHRENSTRSARSPHNEGDKVPKKRGRPRLYLGDQEAADRRREQVRAAQQAYRLRKEKAITDLTGRATLLEKTIQHINQSFLEFHANVAESGLLSSHPELAGQFRDFKQRLFTLSKDVNVEWESQGAGGTGGTAAAGGSPGMTSEDSMTTSPPQPQGIVFEMPETTAETQAATITTSTAKPDILPTMLSSSLPLDTTTTSPAYDMTTMGLVPIYETQQTTQQQHNGAVYDTTTYSFDAVPQQAHVTPTSGTPHFMNEPSFSVYLPPGFTPASGATATPGPGAGTTINLFPAPVQTTPTNEDISPFMRRVIRLCLEKALFLLRDTSAPQSFVSWVLGPLFTQFSKQQLIQTFQTRLQSGLLGPIVNQSDEVTNGWSAADWAFVRGLNGRWLYLEEVEQYLHQRGIVITGESNHVWINPQLLNPSEINRSLQ